MLKVAAKKIIRSILCILLGVIMATLTTPKTDWVVGDGIINDDLNRIEGNIQTLAYGAWIEMDDVVFDSLTQIGYNLNTGILSFEGDISSRFSLDTYIKINGVFDDGIGGTVPYAYGIVKNIVYLESPTDLTRLTLIFNLPDATDANICPEVTDTFTDFYYSFQYLPDIPKELKKPIMKIEDTVSINLGAYYSDVTVLISRDTQAVTVYVYPDSNDIYYCPLNTESLFVQMNTGQINFSEMSGATIYNLDEEYKTAEQYAIVGLKKIAPNLWTLVGQTGS